MIGNDVVDLRAASQQSNWRRKGFLDKVFSTSEKSLIHEAKDQDQMVWLLWSMKEAAYKARQRLLRLPRLLDWKSFECTIFNLTNYSATGLVESSGYSFFTTSALNVEVIHSIARNDHDLPVKHEFLMTSSNLAKGKLLSIVAEQFSVPKNTLFFSKDYEGIPDITASDDKIRFSFSFSDHGRFAAFSLPLIIC